VLRGLERASSGLAKIIRQYRWERLNVNRVLDRTIALRFKDLVKKEGPELVREIGEQVFQEDLAKQDQHREDLEKRVSELESEMLAMRGERMQHYDDELEKTLRRVRDLEQAVREFEKLPPRVHDLEQTVHGQGPKLARAESIMSLPDFDHLGQLLDDASGGAAAAQN